MPPSLEGKRVPGGVSDSCLYNSHSECRSPNCGCSCHKPEVNPNIPIPPSMEGGPEKACPKCGVRRPFVEVFCRVDGERLASLLCGMCGTGMNPEDAFCHQCGAPKGTISPKRDVVKVPQVVVTPPLEGEIDYARQVLEGVQRELEGVNGDEPSIVVKGIPQQVVEQPGRSQGSFKLVSSPNPNKVRVPSVKLPAGTSTVRRLPIKPS